MPHSWNFAKCLHLKSACDLVFLCVFYARLTSSMCMTLARALCKWNASFYELFGATVQAICTSNGTKLHSFTAKTSALSWRHFFFRFTPVVFSACFELQILWRWMSVCHGIIWITYSLFKKFHDEVFWIFKVFWELSV